MTEKRTTSLQKILSYSLPLLLVACGSLKVFDGTNDEEIGWSTEGGFEVNSIGGQTANACASSLETSDIVLAAGDSPSAVTSDFTLPLSEGACAVSWNLNAEAAAWVNISGANASVTRPNSLSDGTATLTASVSYGGTVVTKTFTVVIKTKVVDPVSFEKANECQSGFSSSNITLSGSDTTSSVKQNFTLPSSATIGGNTCSFTTWKSNNSAISISGNTATVARPADDSSNATVTLTAVAGIGGETSANTVSVTLTVPKYTEAESVAACKTALTADDFTNITKTGATAGTIAVATTSIGVPSSESGVGGKSCTISWSSDNTPYLSISGAVGSVTHEYDATDKFVTLTPTIVRGSQSDSSKPFTMRVRTKFTLATPTLFAAGTNGTDISLVYSAATTSDSATVNYKICWSKTQADVSTISAMDSTIAGKTCETKNQDYPSTSPLSIAVSGAANETWYVFGYAFVVGQPNVDSKKIVYPSIATAQF